MLTERQSEVLRTIVRLYSQNEEPVGSKTFLEASGMQVSPATIRNDMKTLEEAGYLQKTHSSSGRVPSYAGYRYYVDHLIDEDQQVDISNEDKQVIEDLFADRSYEPLQIANLAANIIVSLTDSPSFVFGQSQQDHRVEEFKLVPLDDNRLIAIMITDHDYVEQEVFLLTTQIDRDQLNQVSNLLNLELHGVILEEVYQRMKLTIPFQIQRITGQQVDFSELIEKAIYQLKGHRYVSSGKENIFNLLRPDAEINTMKQLYLFFDGSREMIRMLENFDPGLNVTFAPEIPHPDIKDISMVTGTYHYEDQKITLGVIGPTTMPYHRVIGILKRMINELLGY